MRDAKSEAVTKTKAGSFSPRSPSDQGPLRIVSGRLFRSLQVAFNQSTREGRTFANIEGYQLTYGKESSVPYANIHEKGGTFTVMITDRMRRFFWAMWRETGEIRYFRMAITKKKSFSITIPKRAYAEPAIIDIFGRLSDKALEFVTEELQKSFPLLDG